MPTEFTSIPDDFSTPAKPVDMPFAPAPAWDHSAKARRRFGARSSEAQVSPEPRSFNVDPIETRPPTQPTTLSDDARAYEARMDAVPDTAFAPEPVYVTRAPARKSSAAPLAIVAGIILLGGAGAAAWYYGQPHDQGVAQLTPGSATTTTTEVASAAPATAPLDAPVAAPIEAATPRAVARTTTTTASRAPARTTVTHSRVRSASDQAADVSTTAPVQATPAPAPAAAAAPPAPLVLTLPPKPAPTQATPPAEVPVPQQTAPAPTQTPPT